MTDTNWEQMEICIHHKGTPCFRDALLEHHIVEKARQEERASTIKELYDRDKDQWQLKLNRIREDHAAELDRVEKEKCLTCLEEGRKEGYREGSKNTYGELNLLTSYREGFEMGKAEVLLAREEGRQEGYTEFYNSAPTLVNKLRQEERTRIINLIQNEKPSDKIEDK